MLYKVSEFVFIYLFYVPCFGSLSQRAFLFRLLTFSSSGCASICPLAALKEYISRSETVRFRSGHFVSKLFWSFIRPYNPVSPMTIARWIMSVLQSAGIDTSKFKAHCVRGAATSHAYVTGTPVADILKMADWSSECVFRRHYLRDVLE